MIPDDEPWWMVRANTDNGLASAIGDGYGGSSNALPCTCPLADVPVPWQMSPSQPNPPAKRLPTLIV